MRRSGFIYVYWYILRMFVLRQGIMCQMIESFRLSGKRYNYDIADNSHTIRLFSIHAKNESTVFELFSSQNLPPKNGKHYGYCETGE